MKTFDKIYIVAVSFSLLTSAALANSPTKVPIPIPEFISELFASNLPAPKSRLNKTSTFEEAYEKLQLLVFELRGYVHEESIDLTNFDANCKDIMGRSDELIDYLGTSIRDSHQRDDFLHALRFPYFMNGVNELHKLFKECDYWGADLVEDMGKLHLRILKMYPLSNETADPDFASKMSSIKYKYAVLKERAGRDLKMSLAMRRILLNQLENVNQTLLTESFQHENKPKACRGLFHYIS